MLKNTRSALSKDVSSDRVILSIVVDRISNLLSRAKQLHDGLTVKCERHSKKMALLENKDDFDIECPDSRCSEMLEYKYVD